MESSRYGYAYENYLPSWTVSTVYLECIGKIKIQPMTLKLDNCLHCSNNVKKWYLISC